MKVSALKKDAVLKISTFFKMLLRPNSTFFDTRNFSMLGTQIDIEEVSIANNCKFVGASVIRTMYI